MWSAIAAALGAAKALFSWFGDLRRAKERAEYREAGADKQKVADQDQTIKAKDEQLKMAANRRRGDSRKRLRDGTF